MFGQTPLHVITNASLVDTLFNKGAELEVWDNNGNTPIHVACVNERIDIVEALLAHGVRTDTNNYAFQNPLDIAEKIQNKTLVSILSRVSTPPKFENLSLERIFLGVSLLWLCLICLSRIPENGSCLNLEEVAFWFLVDFLFVNLAPLQIRFLWSCCCIIIILFSERVYLFHGWLVLYTALKGLVARAEISSKFMLEAAKLGDEQFFDACLQPSFVSARHLFPRFPCRATFLLFFEVLQIQEP
eukprot:TRINITY_DN3099_c1_g1_i4.p1 TRINITY_DN3099_c1_g1~~TRINITY_DN3099_c1_g1_i4.p1  ORF type:complete len:243 (-),score=36.62 TRINITY_DN3099_c1_g1_i4:283-1011(-)